MRSPDPAILPGGYALPDGEPTLLGYQQRLLATTAIQQVTVCQKSRRIGFTWAIALDAVLHAARRKADGGMDVFYLAYEKEMTREFIDTCAAWCKVLNLAIGDFGEVEETLYEGDDKSVLAFRIKFSSGFEIVALSSKPRGLRGRQGYVIVDEAAFHDDLAEVIKAALALLMWGGKVLIISTHNGVDNPFNGIIDEIKAGRRPFALVTVKLDDALADGLYRRICLVTDKTWSAEAEAAWRQSLVDFYGDGADEELFCIPSEGGGAWIPYELIVAAEHADAGKPELYAGGTCFGGNDIARRRDQWVSTIGERVGDVLWVREEEVLQGATFAEHDHVTDRQFSDFRILRYCLDQTGMGEKPVEDAQRRHGALRVEGVIMSGDRRLNVATAAKQAFENGKIRIKAGDADLRRQISAVKRVPGPTGAPRLVTGRDKVSHGDRAWALFLMIAAAAGAAEPSAGETVDAAEDEAPPDSFLGRPRASMFRGRA
ncbi:MAG: hypothetical protein GC150_15410 [Rhizobiales bacterium]|nr:hypothetical protein [Hyphomicrobiales bacterium]